MRVSELSLQLGIDPKIIRRFLRSRYGTIGTGERWDLNPERVEAVRFSLSGREGATHSDGILIPAIVKRQTSPEIKVKVKALRDSPQDVVVPIVGGESLVFHRVIRSWSGRGKRFQANVVLLSNGTFLGNHDPGAPSSFWGIDTDSHLIKVDNTWWAHHKNYVDRLLQLQIPSSLATILIGRGTHRDDTPQEILIDYYRSTLAGKLSPSSILKLEITSGKSSLDLTLKQVMELENCPATGYRRGTDDLDLAFSRYLATVNLLVEDLENSEVFDITLGEVYRRFFVDVGKRAEGLRKDVAEKLGFKAYKDGWVKKKDQDEVSIESDLRVFVNRTFVCITSAKTSHLPYDDEIARRMLAVATAHRDQISTIRGENRVALERLFPIGSGQ